MTKTRPLAATERELEILRISEALAERGFYVFGMMPAPGVAVARVSPPRSEPPEPLN